MQKKSLLRAFLIWLKAATSLSKGVLWPWRRQKDLCIHTNKYYHKLSYLLFVLLQIHLSFQRKRKHICSSHRSPFLPPPFPLLGQEDKPYILTTPLSCLSPSTRVWVCCTHKQTLFSPAYLSFASLIHRPITTKGGKFFLPYTALPILFYHLFSTQQAC